MVGVTGSIPVPPTTFSFRIPLMTSAFGHVQQVLRAPPKVLCRVIQRACPSRWNHLAEKESRQINMLEQILIGECLPRDMIQHRVGLT